MSALIAEAEAIVAEAVRLHLSAGLKRALAFAAELLGLSPRRTRAYWHHEVVSVREAELEQLRARQKAAVTTRLRRLDEERAALWRRLEDMEASRAEVVAVADGADAAAGGQADRPAAGAGEAGPGPRGLAAPALSEVSDR